MRDPVSITPSRRPSVLLLLLLALAAGLVTLAGDAGAQPCAVEDAKLTSATGQLGDFLGWGVAIDGDTAVAGAQGDDEGATNTGSATVFVQSGGSWTEQAELIASDGAAGDEFGSSVGISGDTVVVGAPDADALASNNGAAYVFVRSGTTWTQQAKLTASDGLDDDAFGIAVAIDGDTIVVGAELDDTTASNTGSAYVFTRSGTTWTEQAKLTASDAAPGDQMGHAVAVLGDRALVGAHEDDDRAAGSGSAYVFERSGTTWTQQAKLTASDPAVSDIFGFSVALAGDRALVGAPNADIGGNGDAGAAYVFSWNGVSWAQEAKLSASDGLTDDNFGLSVALDDFGPLGCTRAVIGAINATSGGFADAGAAYLFTRKVAWTQTTKLEAADAADNDLAGFSVALDDDLALVGAPLDTDVATLSGSAYVWDLADTTPPVLSPCADISVPCDSPAGATVNYAPPAATDDCDPAPTVVCSPPPGSVFPVGTTSVTCTATDCSGNVTSCVFFVTVTDQPPVITCPPDATFDCTGSLGVFVFYDDPDVTDDCDPDPMVECDPPSGAFIPPGVTTITCTATDSAGNVSQCSWDVTIIPDTTPPAFPPPLPPDLTVECTGEDGAVVNFPLPPAVDDCDPDPTVVCNPPAGSTFPIGTTTVTCTATDDKGNSNSIDFTVTVEDTTDPVLFCAAVTVECTEPGEQAVSFPEPAVFDICDDDPDVECVPASPIMMSPGDAPVQVTCTATDEAGNDAMCTFSVSLVDTTAPELDCADLDVECTVPGEQVVEYPDPDVTDACDDDPDVVCVPPSPLVMNPGDVVTVTCTATDADDNESQCTFDVSLVDTTPPDLTCPKPIVLPCEGPDTVVEFEATATDLCDPDPEITYVPDSGTAFPVGTTTVTVTAADDEGNESQCTFTVTITDDTPPVITCPEDVTAVGEGPTVVNYPAPAATDDCDDEVVVVCVPPSGSTFPVGATVVSCTATDDAGNESTCTFTVTVEPPLPPSFPLGCNWQVFSNGMDVIYGGLGAGGSQVSGVDGIGTWIAGEEIRGSILNPRGDYGYWQYGWVIGACVLGPPVAGLSLDFPAVSVTEMDGRNPNDPDVFLTPGCATAGGLIGLTSGGYLPYGTPPGSSVSFLAAALPATSFLPSGLTCYFPNHGIVPSLGGSATLIAAGGANLPIASTGFCWAVQFIWTPTCLGAGQESDGWWMWFTNSRYGNQYWAMSNDELNVVQSQSVASDAGATALLTFFAPTELEFQALATEPSTNDALAPAGFNGSGPYYSTGGACPGDGDPGVITNGGFDLGRHVGLSLSGSGGAINPNTGLGAQDPSGSPLGSLVPSLGFVTWNNADFDGDGIPGGGGTSYRLTWVQLDLDASLGTDPALQGSVPLHFGQVRAPIGIPVTPYQTPGAPWPGGETALFWTLYLHATNDYTGDPCWPDPFGFASGSFGIPQEVGASFHFPTASTTSVCVGVPVQMDYGSSGLLGPAGPLTWDPNVNPPSLGRTLILID